VGNNLMYFTCMSNDQLFLRKFIKFYCHLLTEMELNCQNFMLNVKILTEERKCYSEKQHCFSSQYIHTYISWIYKCVTKTTGCATSHKYINIHNFTV
jgi:hypothetical protein